MRVSNVKTLDELNLLLAAWLDKNYHEKVHSEIEKTPKEAFSEEAGYLKFISPEEIYRIFLYREERKVNKTAVISVCGNQYEVDARLARKTIEVKYHPSDLTKIEVYYQGDKFADAKLMVNKAVISMYNANKIPVIVVDEAHLLSDAMLEEIRFLINFDMDSMSPLSLILVGQSELRQRLKLKTLEAIAQRVMINYHFDGLDRSGTEDYILTHLKVAGLGTPLFTDEAISEIFQYTGGIPRKINNICKRQKIYVFTHDLVFDKINPVVNLKAFYWIIFNLFCHGDFCFEALVLQEVLWN